MRVIVKIAFAACAFIMLSCLIAPTAAQAKTWTLNSNSEIDRTWGKAYYTYELVGLPNALSDNVAKRYFKYNVLIDLKDEGSQVPLNGVTKNFNFQLYTKNETDKIAVDSVTKRGRYFFWTTHGDDPLPLSRSTGEFYVIGQGSGSLSIAKSTFTPAEAGSIPQALQLKNNTNTNSANSVVYTYTGVTFSNGGYHSTTPPTEPGSYSVYADVPSDKANYLHSYTTNSVSFTIESNDFIASMLDTGMYYRDGRTYDGGWTNQNLLYVYKDSRLDRNATFELLRNGELLTGASRKPGVSPAGDSFLSFDITSETAKDSVSVNHGDNYGITNFMNGFNQQYERGVKIDKTNPTVNATFASDTGKLTVKAEDGLSGIGVSEINTKNVRVNGGEWQKASDVLLTEVGSYSVSVRAVDRAGNMVVKDMVITVSTKITPVIPSPNPGQDDEANPGDGLHIHTEIV